MNKLKKRIKQNKKQTIRIVWLILGVLIIVWNIYWFVKVTIKHEYGIVGNVIKYNLGIFVLILYILINIIISLIRKLREYKNLKHHPYK